MEASVKANYRRAKMLIVEDNDDQWVIIQQAMRQELNEVMVQRVSTTEQAVNLLESWRHQEWEIPKLILLDLYVPQNVDGWQLLRYIKTMPTNFSRIPIVIFSSSEIPADILESYQLGISSYLVKPVHYADWVIYFRELRAYWWETVTLPPVQYGH